ncbi:MAG: HEPN domain-containing protein [bacterium]
MTEELTLKGFWWTPDVPDRRWFGVLKQTEKAIELVCHSDHGEEGVLAQALDAYHGVRFNSHKDRDFQKKIAYLLKLNDGVMSGLVSDIAVFAEQVLATRNYYTHHNPKCLLDGKVAQGRDLMRMNEKLRILLQSCVICDIGLPVERCAVLRHQIASEIVMY